MNKEVDLSVSCYGKVKDRKYDIVILPWGATEPHNLHLPYMTDCILSHDVAVDAALIAKQKYGVNCMVMPPIGMGSQNPGQRERWYNVEFKVEDENVLKYVYTLTSDNTLLEKVLMDLEKIAPVKFEYNEDKKEVIVKMK